MYTCGHCDVNLMPCLDTYTAIVKLWIQ